MYTSGIVPLYFSQIIVLALCSRFQHSGLFSYPFRFYTLLFEGIQYCIFQYSHIRSYSL